MIKFDGYDEAIIGSASVWHPDGSREDRMVYDGEAILDLLISRDGMTREEAMEFIDFNVEGGYLGPDTPIVTWRDVDLSDFGDDQ